MSTRPRIQAPEEEDASFTLKRSENSKNKRRLSLKDNDSLLEKKTSKRISINFKSNSPKVPIINYDDIDEIPMPNEKPKRQEIKFFNNDESPNKKASFSSRAPIKFGKNASSPLDVIKRQLIKSNSNERPIKKPSTVIKRQLVQHESSSPTILSKPKRKLITFNDERTSSSRDLSTQKESSEIRGTKRKREDRSESPKRREPNRKSRRESPSFTSKFARRQSIQLNQDSPRSSNDSFFRSPAPSNERVNKCNFQQPPVYKSEDGRLYVAFFTNKYIFSNHFFCPSGITVDGLHFPTTEHYYMYQKAVFSDNERVANEIKRCNDPKQAKRIASKLEGFDNDGWKKIQYKVMEKACLAKFQQNPTLRRELFRTCNAVLVEASPSDRRWGVGLTLDDEDIADETKWKGTNLLGKLLMNVRMTLATEFADEFEKEHLDAQRDLHNRAIIC